MSKTKFAIGCLVQWYEVEMVSEYIETLNDAINEYDGNVLVDVTLVMNQDLEKTSLDRLEFLNIKDRVKRLFGKNVNYRDTTQLHTIADYRREFNERYSDEVDVLVWGESDMLVPKQMFTSLDTLHQNVDTPKYLATFGICKMWDSSWKPLEHPEFTDKPFIEGDSENWWNIPYTMNKDEMNQFNDKVTDLDVSIISPHKFNGCGLVISSEVVRAGVNIPKSVFFIHEDTSFMMMTQKVLGNIPQYHFRNILLVHNRKNPKKRMYVLNEDSDGYVDDNRKKNGWYNTANKFCEQNVYNLFNPNYKSYNWNDVWNTL
jgi:hypothetical protein